MGMGGVFKEVLAPERLIATQLFDTDWTQGETLVTHLFTEQRGGTLLRMTVVYASRAARDGALESGMTTGMQMSYGRLDAALEAWASNSEPT